MTDVPHLEPAMQASCATRRVELAELARQQHGVVARWQLRGLGFTTSAIGRRVAADQLHPIHPGVYAVGHSRLSVKGLFIAAVYYGGADAILSHRSAAELWDLIRSSSPRIEVTGMTRRRGRRDLTWHETRSFHPDDREVQDNIPVTSVARTLLDLAEVVNERRLARAFEEAERLHLLDLRKINQLLERSRGRRGLKPLTALVHSQTRPPPRTRSDLERDFLDFCDRTGLPRPQTNLWVEGYEVDALWPQERLIVELDSFEFHRGRAAFERDRARDARLQVAGYRTLRVTSRRLEGEPQAIEREIRALRTRRA
jgi:uncharacterized protein DUF559/putative AbiEi antitoxin of type IV toxin-antitoxin system